MRVTLYMIMRRYIVTLLISIKQVAMIFTIIEMLLSMINPQKIVNTVDEYYFIHVFKKHSYCP